MTTATSSTLLFLVSLTSFWGGQQEGGASAFSFSQPRCSRSHHHRHVAAILPIAAATNNNNDDDDYFFDPFLRSPHDYPDGVDNGPEDYSDSNNNNGVGAVDEIFESSASFFGFSSILSTSSSYTPNINNYDNDAASSSSDDYSLFDPLLSPHAYPHGIDAGPVGVSTTETTSQQQQQLQANTKKIGILLIDHGSKREASNQHLHFIAETYEASIIQRDATTTTTTYEGGRQTTTTVVRAAHMEIAEPSILTSLVSMYIHGFRCFLSVFLSSHSFILSSNIIHAFSLLLQK